MDSLKRKLAKDSELHRTDNLRIMQVSGRLCTCLVCWEIMIISWLE